MLFELYRPIVSRQHSRRSYAQEGEDLVVDRLLGGKADGRYVEVGCHHPFRYSNTYLFYARGWSGVCIDPLPGTALLFSRYRRRDTVIEKGVSLEPGVLTYYMFNDAALNTFDERVARERDGKGSYRIERQIQVQTQPLSRLLADAGVAGGIDILSVDVEGLDLDVLRSNDWQRCRPRIVIAEALDSDVEGLASDPVTQYLRSLGYRARARTGHSVIYMED